MIIISMIMIKTKTSHKTGKPFKDRLVTENPTECGNAQLRGFEARFRSALT